MQRILALDVGDATIGVAVTDPLGITAQGVTTIHRVGVKKDTDKVYTVSGDEGENLDSKGEKKVAKST